VVDQVAFLADAGSRPSIAGFIESNVGDLESRYNDMAVSRPLKLPGFLQWLMCYNSLACIADVVCRRFIHLSMMSTGECEGILAPLVPFSTQCECQLGHSLERRNHASGTRCAFQPRRATCRSSKTAFRHATYRNLRHLSSEVDSKTINWEPDLEPCNSTKPVQPLPL